MNTSPPAIHPSSPLPTPPPLYLLGYTTREVLLINVHRQRRSYSKIRPGQPFLFFSLQLQLYLVEYCIFHSSIVLKKCIFLHCLKCNRFPRYSTKCSGEMEIFRGIFRVLSRFPLNFMLYLGNFDYFLDSEFTDIVMLQSLTVHCTPQINKSQMGKVMGFL